MAPASPQACSVCAQEATPSTPLKKCGKCQQVAYCGADCQKAAWPAHRRYCGGAWWDNAKYRKQQDGSFHGGRMELVTWGYEAIASRSDDEDMGWGATLATEAEELKAKFENEMQGDEKKLYEYWPQAFRWTCCGTSADMDWGCDHHGTGAKACTCDFCQMGKPLTETIYNTRLRSQHAKGLTLPRGPDPRSFNSAQAGIHAAARSRLGMDN